MPAAKNSKIIYFFCSGIVLCKIILIKDLRTQSYPGIIIKKTVKGRKVASILMIKGSYSEEITEYPPFTVSLSHKIQHFPKDLCLNNTKLVR